MIALSKTKFLMDFHKHAKELNTFLPFYGP